MKMRREFYIKEHLQGVLIGFLTGGTILIILHLLNVID